MKIPTTNSKKLWLINSSIITHFFCKGHQEVEEILLVSTGHKGLVLCCSDRMELLVNGDGLGPA